MKKMRQISKFFIGNRFMKLQLYIKERIGLDKRYTTK